MWAGGSNANTGTLETNTGAATAAAAAHVKTLTGDCCFGKVISDNRQVN